MCCEHNSVSFRHELIIWHFFSNYIAQFHCKFNTHKWNRNIWIWKNCEYYDNGTEGTVTRSAPALLPLLKNQQSHEHLTKVLNCLGTTPSKALKQLPTYVHQKQQQNMLCHALLYQGWLKLQFWHFITIVLEFWLCAQNT